MKELILKLKEANRLDALDSVEALKEAAKEFGYLEGEVERLLEDFGGFPLDDDEIERIAGGLSANPHCLPNKTVPFWFN